MRAAQTCRAPKGRNPDVHQPYGAPATRRNPFVRDPFALGAFGLWSGGNVTLDGRPKDMTRLRFCLLSLCLATLVAGCTSFDEVDAAIQAAKRPAPKLIAVDGILDEADAVGTGEDASASLTARADALRDKAGRLRGM